MRTVLEVQVREPSRRPHKWEPQRWRAAVLTVFLALFLPASLFSAEQWVKLTTPNFELFTTAGEKKGREAVLYFEQVRSFFIKIGRSKRGSSLPVRIVAFQSEKEFKPYRVNEFAIAYYVGGFDRDYIVMRSITPENYPVAIHEYVHLIVKHTGREPPVWLNEGLAEVWSTLKPMGGKMKVGDLIPGHRLTLQTGKWLSLETLFAVDHDSPLYNERNKAGMFYAESWALAHMLNLSPEYRSRLEQFMLALYSGTPPGPAFQQAYGKSVDQIQKDLRAYISGSRFFAAEIEAKLEKAAQQPDAQAAPSLESGMVLADLSAASGKRKEAKEMYLKLARENPANWKVEEALAYLSRRNAEKEEARRHFARAVELGCTDGKLYLDYAMLLREADQKDPAIVPVLRKAVEVNPQLQEAHLLLGYYFLNARNYKEAVDHLKQVKQVSGQQAPYYFRALAYAYHQIGVPLEARTAAERARKLASSPEEISSAEELLRFVNQSPAESASQPVSGAAATIRDSEEDERPRLARKSNPPPDPPPEDPEEGLQNKTIRREPTYPIEGVLQQLDCLGKFARLHIASGGKRMAFLIQDPTSVTIKNSASGAIDFPCGPQKPRPVVLDYVMKQDKELGTVGIIRSIEFK